MLSWMLFFITSLPSLVYGSICPEDLHTEYSVNLNRDMQGLDSMNQNSHCHILKSCVV